MNDWPTFHDHPPEPVSITYSLAQHGWASMIVRVGDSDVDVGSFGYLTDALGDLVRAAVAIATGAISAQMIVNGEPMLWGLAIHDGWQSTRRPQAYRFSIRVSHGDEASPSPVLSWSDKLVEGYVAADAFAMAVSKAAHEVLIEHGEAGYLARWREHPFPMRALVALDAALVTPPGEPRMKGPLSV
jgi:hypothetical protein